MGYDKLKVYITEYYKMLFGASALNNVSLVEDFVHDIPQLSPYENDILTADFSMEEVYDAISQMELNSHLDQTDSLRNSIKLFRRSSRKI